MNTSHHAYAGYHLSHPMETMSYVAGYINYTMSKKHVLETLLICFSLTRLSMPISESHDNNFHIFLQTTYKTRGLRKSQRNG